MEHNKKWHDERQKGIGGSDAPVVVLGESYGKTKADLWAEKVYGIREEIDNPDVRRGRRQESVAAEVYQEMTGRSIHRVPQRLKHDKYPFIQGFLDYERYPDRNPLEIKCPRTMKYLQIKRTGLSDEVLIQGNHYLSLFPKAKKVVFFIFAAELDEGIDIEIERDDNLIDMILEKELEFWHYVETKTLPPIAEVPKIELPKIKGKIMQVDDPHAKKVINDLKIAKEIEKEASELVESIKEEIQDHWPAGYEGIQCDNDRIYWSWSKGRKTLDKKKLIADGIDPAKYETIGNPYRTFKTYFNLKEAK